MDMVERPVRELRLGVVGLGVIARFYLAAIELVPGVRLAAVCDLDPARLEPFQPPVRRYRDHRLTIADGEVDALVVATPNDSHAAICRDALAAGMPVCVEKPLALDLRTGGELCRLAAEHGTVLFTSFHRRYNRAVLALRAALRAAESSGAVVRAMTVRYLERIEEHAGPDSWYLEPARCGGGCLADNGPSAFDLVRLLLGPATVVASTLRRDGSGVDRQAAVELRTGGGVPVRIELDWGYPGERKTVEARLADGTLHVADMLGGYRGFKASLWHEYVGLVTEFAERVRRGIGAVPDNGIDAVAFVAQAYARAGHVDLAAAERG